MTEERRHLAQMLESLLADQVGLPAELGPATLTLAEPAWDALSAAGVTLLGVSESAGGGGGDLADAALVVRAAARHSIAVPVAENCLLAGWLLATCGLPVPDGPMTAAVGRVETWMDGTSRRLRGTIERVPWTSGARQLVVLSTADDPVVASIPIDAVHREAGANLAGEPRDTITIDTAVPAAAVVRVSPDLEDEYGHRLALARAVGLAGAAEQALALCQTYVVEREQFGRPIARFQAVQQLLAELAGEVAAMSTVADHAVLSATAGGTASPLAQRAIAVAKARTSAGAGIVARIAHQLHGAMGFTQEHRLRLATTRLWSWREEGGNEVEWASTVGARALTGGVWADVTASPGSLDRSSHTRNG